MLQTHIQTRAFKNRQRKHEAWLSFIQTEISMSTYLVILGEPPGRALFNVKSRTLRVLTTVFLLMESILSPWQLLSFFIIIFYFFLLLSKKRVRTPIPRKDMNWEKNLLWGTHIPPLHLEFAKLQVYEVQASFSSCSSSRHIEVL